jgi:hypothetical protein
MPQREDGGELVWVWWEDVNDQVPSLGIKHTCTSSTMLRSGFD